MFSNNVLLFIRMAAVIVCFLLTAVLFKRLRSKMKDNGKTKGEEEEEEEEAEE